MKKLFIISAIAISGLIYKAADAQIRVHVGLRFGAPRAVYATAPVVIAQAPVYEQPQSVYNGSDDDYYYLPDVGAYYDVNEQCYYYYDGNDWISSAYLPGAYRNYDWRNAPRYEIRASRPYMRDDFYKQKYNGHASDEWARNNHDNHFNNGNANRGNDNRQNFDNRGRNAYDRSPQQDRRQVDNGQRFDNKGQGGNRQQNQPNRGQSGNDQRADTRGQGGYDQSAKPNQAQPGNIQHGDDRGQGSSGQSAQPNHGQNGGQQHSDRGGQGGNSQPSNQSGNHDNDPRGNGDHYAQNSPKGGFGSHRMAKF